MVTDQTYHVGDYVVYAMPKRTSHPSPRAKGLEPEQRGEDYVYVVEKYWVVDAVQNDALVIRTRTGKHRRIDPNDPRLHKAHWWERLLHLNRFPKLSDA